MVGKPGVTTANLVMIPLLMFMALTSDAAVVQSLSYLLHDEDFYDKTVDEAAHINANAATYSLVFSMPALLLSGLVYDLLGRRWSLISFFLLGGVSTMLFPLVSPSITKFDIVRVFFQISFVSILGNTLVNDYVRVQSRGLATGMQSLGQNLGNLTAVAGIFTVAKERDNKLTSFGLMSSL